MLGRYAPQARVVYVDIDPVAIAHSRLILAGNELATAIQEDVRHVAAILDHPDTRALLDLDQPLGLILAAILHAIPDDGEAYHTMDRLPVEAKAAEEVTRRTNTPGRIRSRAEVLRFFTGLDLVEPGLVWTPQWRPDRPEDVGAHPERLIAYAGVGHKA